MRSRTLQPRALFRIANAAATTATSSRASAPPSAVAAAAAAAVASTSTSSSPLSTSSATHLANTSRSPPWIAHARSSSTSACSAPSYASSSSSRTRHRSRSNSLRRSRQQAAAAAATSSTTTTAASSTSQSSSPFASRRSLPLSPNPVIPVRPPPHSNVSLGLQSFFAQGRPLLEHNNLFDHQALTVSSGDFVPGQTHHHDSTGAGNVGTAAAMVLVMPAEHADGLAEQQQQQQQQQHATSADSTEPQPNADGIDAVVKRKATALIERMFDLRQQMRNAPPSERKQFLKQADLDATTEFLSNIEGLLDGSDHIGDVEFSAGGLQSTDILTFSLHLPPLRSISKSTFDRLVDSAAAAKGTSSSSSSSSPLALHAGIAAEQSWESEQKRAVEAAKERGEDTLLAQRLGPESDLVVLGEPEGPSPNWGKGVASYLARYGRPFQSPPLAAAGEDAAKLKTLDDMMTYHVTDGLSANPADLLDQSSSTASEDVHMWLGHALVQDKTKAGVAWSRTMEQLGSQVAALDVAKVEGLQAFSSINEPTRGLQTVAIDAPSSSSSSSNSAEADEGLVVQMDSVRRKRRKKMNKMKYKKLRKKQRAERQRLKK